MFFPERIRSINKQEKVLEVGPGNTPFYRSNILLEKVFDDDEVAKLQAGGTEKKDLKKEIVYYNDDKFPFENNSFDYVICSHVLEHIPKSDIEFFISELSRVAKNGYLEVPIYNFELIAKLKYHVNYIYIDGNQTIHFLSKEDVDTNDNLYNALREHLLNIGFNRAIIPLNLEIFGNGFEFKDKISFVIHENFNSFYEIINDEKKAKNIQWNKGVSYYLKKILYLFKPNIFKQKLYNKFGIV